MNPPKASTLVFTYIFGAVSALAFSLQFPLRTVTETPDPRQFVILVTPGGAAVGEAKPGLDVDHVLDTLKSEVKPSESSTREKFFIPDKSGNNTF